MAASLSIIRRFFMSALLLSGLMMPAQDLTQNHDKSCMMALHLGQVKASVVSIQAFTFHEGHSWKRIGSGCCYYKPGYVITRQSVVQGGDSIVVTLSNGLSYNACLVDCDAASQVAVLKSTFTGNHMATAGRTDTLQNGHCIAILGNSLGVFPSVTLGHYHGMHGNGMLELDGNVAPGNSGSPIFTEDGKLIGLLAGRKTIDEDEEKTIGLALPIETIDAVMEKMSAYLESQLGWVGMRVMDLSDSAQPNGVKVMYVAPRGPADQAGIVKGDTLVHFQGESIHNAAQLRNWVHGTQPEETVVFGVKQGAEVSAHRVKVHSLEAF